MYCVCVCLYDLCGCALRPLPFPPSLFLHVTLKQPRQSTLLAERTTPSPSAAQSVPATLKSSPSFILISTGFVFPSSPRGTIEFANSGAPISPLDSVPTSSLASSVACLLFVCGVKNIEHSVVSSACAYRWEKNARNDGNRKSNL